MAHLLQLRNDGPELSIQLSRVPGRDEERGHPVLAHDATTPQSCSQVATYLTPILNEWVVNDSGW